MDIDLDEPIPFSSTVVSCCSGVRAEGPVIGLSCRHKFRSDFLAIMAAAEFNLGGDHISCPVCSRPLSDDEVRIINPSYVTQLRCRVLASVNGKECPSCGYMFDYEPGDRPGITTTADGWPIRPDALECLRLNRATCPNCEGCFCVDCFAIPFHEGYTCEEQHMKAAGIVCRFCSEPAADGDCLPSLRTCTAQECRANLVQVCKFQHPCGHPCCGFHGEACHIPCDVCDGLICAYCGDDLHTSPSISLVCGHHTHFACVIQHLLSVKPEGELFQPKCGFPGCGALPSHPRIDPIVQEWRPIIARMDRLRAKVVVDEDLDHDERVLNPDDRDYFGNPQALAQSICRFFRCERCRKAYYGGHRECAEEEQEGDRAYRCPHCQTVVCARCEKHGEMAMRFKCCYCCREANWFCAGTIHFCDQCHAGYPGMNSEVHPACQPGCIFAPHPPNGTQQTIGICAVCEGDVRRKRRRRKQK